MILSLHSMSGVLRKERGRIATCRQGREGAVSEKAASGRAAQGLAGSSWGQWGEGVRAAAWGTASFRASRGAIRPGRATQGADALPPTVPCPPPPEASPLLSTWGLGPSMESWLPPSAEPQRPPALLARRPAHTRGVSVL